MTEQQARERFTPVKCNSQLEFDKRMQAINEQQTIENHPYLDRLRELTKQKALIETQKQALNVQLNAIKMERLEIEQQKKNINRVFHQLKHELLQLNPKGLKKEPSEE